MPRKQVSIMKWCIQKLSLKGVTNTGRTGGTSLIQQFWLSDKRKYSVTHCRICAEHRMYTDTFSILKFVQFHYIKGLMMRSMSQLVKICQIAFMQLYQYYVKRLQEVSKCTTHSTLSGLKHPKVSHHNLGLITHQAI